MSEEIIVRGSQGKDYERVVVDEWIAGKIAGIETRVNEHKKIKDKKTGEWIETSVDEVRFKFDLFGYEQPHYSRWLTMSLNEKANLYKLLLQLYPALKPTSTISLSRLVGVEVKTQWIEIPSKQDPAKMFQILDKIRAINPRALPTLEVREDKKEDDEVPFEV